MGNWDNGEKRTIAPGDTLRCEGTIRNVSNAIIMYNTSSSDHSVRVFVTGAISSPPKDITIPGSIPGHGLPTLVLFDGSLTDSVSVAMNQTNSADSRVEVWICSLAFPLDTTGLKNAALPADGQWHNFRQYQRYYFVPESRWYSMLIQNTDSQFFSLLFGPKNAIDLICVNPGPNPQPDVHFLDDQIQQYYSYIQTKAPNAQTYEKQFFGDGAQYVAMSADSKQNAEDARISLQHLSVDEIAWRVLVDRLRALWRYIRH